MAMRCFGKGNHDTVGVADGVNPVTGQLQHFVEDKALGLEQVEIQEASGRQAPRAYLLVKVGQSEQSGHCFLTRDGFENAVSVWRRGCGTGGRSWPVNSGWSGVHACEVWPTETCILQPNGGRACTARSVGTRPIGLRTGKLARGVELSPVDLY